MNWYGPAGIGTGRGIEGFRNWHQIPFLAGMPDRGSKVAEITYHFFGDNDYAAVTGWPNMIQTISHDGWLGILPLGKEITMRHRFLAGRERPDPRELGDGRSAGYV